MRPRAGRHIRRLVAIGALIPLLAACSAGGVAVNPSSDPQPVTIDVASLPRAPSAPHWQLSLDGPVQISLASDGSIATVLGQDGLRAVTAAGTTAWRAGGGGVAFALPAGQVARGPAAGEASGPLDLLGPDGSVLWHHAGVGPITAAAAPDGSRVAIADDGSGQVWLVNPATGTATAIPIAGPANLRFTATGQLVLDDGTQVSVVGAAGNVQRLCPGGCSGPSRTIAPARDAAWLAVATRGGDDTLYVFRKDGSARWSRRLPPGGDDGLAVAPGDSAILLYGLGPRGGLADIAPATGVERWVTFLQAGGQALPVTDAAYGPGGSLLVTARNGAGVYVVRFGSKGTPAAVLTLPAGAAVALAGPSQAALVTTNGPGGRTRVAWYDLSTGS